MAKPAALDSAEQLREAVREANGVLKDLHGVLKALREERTKAEAIRTNMVADLNRMAQEMVDEFGEAGLEVIHAGLGTYDEGIRQYVQACEDRINARFRRFTEILDGEVRDGVQMPSYEQLAGMAASVGLHPDQAALAAFKAELDGQS